VTGNLPVPVVWSEQCLLHDPGGEVWLGVRDAGTEVPARAQVLRDALAAAGAPEVPAAAHGDEVLRAVHDPALLDHLAGVWAEWERAGFPAEYGRDRVVPYVFPTSGMLAGLPLRSPPAVHGRAGQYCYDTMTLVGPGSGAIRGRRRRADRGLPGELGARWPMRCYRRAITPPAPPTVVPATSTTTRDRGGGAARGWLGGSPYSISTRTTAAAPR
jgi:hypothetical protein